MGNKLPSVSCSYMVRIQAVYEEDLIHRQPGVAGPLNASEEGFPATRKWIAEETICDLEDGSAASVSSFTRIVIGELKPEILRDLGCAQGREQLCRQVNELEWQLQIHTKLSKERLLPMLLIFELP